MNIKDLRTEELEILLTINDKLEQQIIDDVVYEEIKNEITRRSKVLDEYVGKIFKQESSNGFDILYIIERNKDYPALLYNEIYFRNDDKKSEFIEYKIISNISYLNEYVEISKEEYNLYINKIKSLSND